MSIIGHLTKCMKKEVLCGRRAPQRPLEVIKGKRCLVSLLPLFIFELLFEVEWDASRVDIESVLT